MVPTASIATGSAVRLAILVSPAAGWTYDEIRDLARDAEAGGLPTFWVSDHFFGGEGFPDRNCLEAWSLLAALARDTRTIRLGTLVTAHSYRNPAYLAKTVASLDHLSGGRIEFGLGAGWKENEYTAYGYEFPAPGIRVTQLRETLEICTRMWTEDRATYRGTQYQIEDALCAPKPMQRPHPPITIGGTKPRIMRVAARYADLFNVGRLGTPPQVPTRAQLLTLLDQLAAAAASVGRDRPLAVSHWTPVEQADERECEALVQTAIELSSLGIVEYQLAVPRQGARAVLERLVRNVLPAAPGASDFG